MSSYLNIYLKTKGEGKYLRLDSHTRSSKLYEAFSETANPPHCYDKDVYKDLAHEDLGKVAKALEGKRKELEDSLGELRGFVGLWEDWVKSPDKEEQPKTLKEASVQELMHDIRECKNEQRAYADALSYVETLYDFDFSYDSDFECIAVNIS